MTPDQLQEQFPELFAVARDLRDRAVAAGGSPGDVRLRCITAADGTVLAGKPPPPDPDDWVTVELSGPRPWDPAPVPSKPQGYRGRRR